MDQDWITIQAAAERLSVNPKTIRRMISRGQIHAQRVGPRMIRVDYTSLQGTPLGTWDHDHA